MIRISARAGHAGPSSRGRTFADEAGRSWTAKLSGEALVFTCVSDGRQSSRATDMTVGDLADDVGDATLREWLSSAPRIGTLI